MDKRRIGLIAGRGFLPFDVLSEIDLRGYSSVVVGLKGESNPELARLADLYQDFGLGQLGAIIKFLNESGVKEIVFAGKVGKEALFKEGFDNIFQSLLASLSEKNDDAILLALVEEFEKNNLTVLKQTDYLEQILAPSGIIVGTEITSEEWEDIRLGFKMAKAIGGLDIGQSVVVKNGVVLAVEAIEGTDQAVIRGGSLGGPGSIVVKVSKPQQDERFDVPTIGLTTIQSMQKVGASLLAIETGKTLVTEKKALIDLASKNGIKIVACRF